MKHDVPGVLNPILFYSFLLQWAGNSGLGLTVNGKLEPGKRLIHLEETTTNWDISPFRIRFLDIVCGLDLSRYSLITCPINSTGSSKFLLGPIVLINNSCILCQNILVKSDNKTLINHQCDYLKYFTITQTVEKGEQILFEYSQYCEEIVKENDYFKFTCIKCGK